MNPLRLEVFQLAVGYWVSKAIYCAAKADVADQLAAGPKPVSLLAKHAKVDAENLHRVLRALASVGIFQETEPQTFALTPKAEFLRADHPETLKHMAIMVCDDLYEVWCDIYHALQTGQSAVKKRFGDDFFGQLNADPVKSYVFDRAMEEIHGAETMLMLAAFDFSKFETVMDVGGGNGSTLRGLLQAHPRLRGRIFDLPPVVENARKNLASDPVAKRVEYVGGSFFEEVPGKSDCIVLRHVLHDWNDAECAKILASCRRALAAGGSLLIVEKVILPGNDPGFAKLLDLNMMAIGGKERTEPQYRELLAKSGLRLHAIHRTPGPIDLVEARA